MDSGIISLIIAAVGSLATAVGTVVAVLAYRRSVQQPPQTPVQTDPYTEPAYGQGDGHTEKRRTGNIVLIVILAVMTVCLVIMALIIYQNSKQNTVPEEPLAEASTSTEEQSAAETASAPAVFSDTTASSSENDLTQTSQTQTVPTESQPETVLSSSQTAAVQKGVSDYLYWNEDGIFIIDTSLLGMTFDELTKLLGVQLSAPEDWPWWGDHLQWTAYDGLAYPNVNFMFQDGKCCMIYHDSEQKLTSALAAKLRAMYDSTLNAYITDGDCYFSAYMETYSETDEQYLRQQYKAASMRM